MKVEGPKGPSPLQRSGPAKKSGEAGKFAGLLQSGEAGEASESAGAMATGGVDGLFLLQTVDDNERKKRVKAKARAEASLTLLDQITYALLNSGVSTAHLARLKAIASVDMEDVADPKLAAVLEEIDLRLAVEAAKLEKASETAESRQ